MAIFLLIASLHFWALASNINWFIISGDIVGYDYNFVFFNLSSISHINEPPSEFQST